VGIQKLVVRGAERPVLEGGETLHANRKKINERLTKYRINKKKAEDRMKQTSDCGGRGGEGGRRREGADLAIRGLGEAKRKRGLALNLDSVVSVATCERICILCASHRV
jgi:hypothetical protein